MGAMLATTLQGRGYFSVHPYSLGFVGDFGTPSASRHANESDYVLASGCSPNPHTMDEGRLLADDATVIHVDTDPSSIERYTQVDLGIVGDARTTASSMVSLFDRDGIDFAEKFWTDRRKRRIAESTTLDDREFPPKDGRMDPKDVVRFLNRVLPEDRLVVADGGHFTNWVLDGIDVTHPDDFVWTLDFAAVGQGLPIAIGAAVGSEHTPVAVCGDAGFMMTVQEVDTAVRNDVPITMVVVNDDGLGSEYHQLEHIGEFPDAALVESPDIATVTAGMGAESHTVRSAAELNELADPVAAADRPLVIDCKVNHEVRHRAYDQMFME